MKTILFVLDYLQFLAFVICCKLSEFTIDFFFQNSQINILIVQQSHLSLCIY